MEEMNKNRILHIMMESPFLEGMGYQENILTRKHKQLGFRVFVVSCKGKLQIPESDMVYTNQDNVSVEYLENNQIRVKYDNVKAVTPGQACVIYLGEQCLMGGIIKQVFKDGKDIWYLK